MNEALTALLGILFGLAVSGAIVAVTAWALPKLRNEAQGYPLEVQVEAALVPLAYEGICAAFRVSEWAMDELGERLHGADKKAIANVMYDLLPDMVGGVPIGVVKTLVSRDRFCVLVENIFAGFERRFMEHEARYEQAFDEWREQMTKPAPILTIGNGNTASVTWTPSPADNIYLPQEPSSWPTAPVEFWPSVAGDAPVAPFPPGTGDVPGEAPGITSGGSDD